MHIETSPDGVDEWVLIFTVFILQQNKALDFFSLIGPTVIDPHALYYSLTHEQVRSIHPNHP
jgi:hypothetical protein